MKQFNFAKKNKAQLYTIITTLLLCVSACAFSNFDCYADGYINLYNSLGMASGATDFSQSGIKCVSASTQTYDFLVSREGFQVPSSILSLEFPYDDYGYFFGADSIVIGYLGVVPKESFICGNENEVICYIPNSLFDGSDYDTFYGFQFRGPLHDQHGSGCYYTYSNFLSSSNSRTIEGVSYRYYDLSDWTLSSTNLRVSYCENPSNPSSEELENNINDNYDSGMIGNVTTEQYDNYEYLTGNSGIYAALTSCNSGKMQFVAQAPTGMNTDNYYIKINGECSYSITVNSLTDTRTKNIVSKYTSYETTSASFTKVISASGTIGASYDLVFEHNGIQLSAMNNGVYNAPQENINSELKSSSGSTMWNLANYCTDNSVALWRGVAGSMGGLSANASAGEYGSYGFSLPTMNVVNGSPMTVNSIVYSYTMTMYNENDESVGAMTKTFTINSDGTVSETEGANTLTVPNETVEENSSGGADYYNHSTDSNDTYNTTNNGTGSSGGSSVNGDNNIIINNNPVNNVNGGSGSGLTETDDSSFGSGFGVISKIISYIAGSKGSSVDKIDELANTDGWLSIVTSSYSFVPIQFWNLIITCFTVCLGIVVVAFIISIVIKLVT